MLSQTRLNSVIKNKENPGIILFDEIEKADGSLFKLLLGIMDNGFLTLGDGTCANFKNFFIFFTSNIGSEITREMGERAIGFDNRARREFKNYEGTKALYYKKFQTKFSPEFVNRIDEFIFFSPLTEEEYRKIAKSKLDKLIDFITCRKYIGLRIKYDEDLISYITRNGVSPLYGAREINRIIYKEIQSSLARILISLAKKETPNGTITITVDNDRLNFSHKLREMAAEN
jgi:ATP-dependent Clp protease ATP-binding subunit ClpA